MDSGKLVGLGTGHDADAMAPRWRGRAPGGEAQARVWVAGVAAEALPRLAFVSVCVQSLTSTHCKCASRMTIPDQGFLRTTLSSHSPPFALCSQHAAVAVCVILGSALASSGLPAECFVASSALSDAAATSAAGCHDHQLACGHAPCSAHLSPLRRRAALRFPCLATAGEVDVFLAFDTCIHSHPHAQAHARTCSEREGEGGEGIRTLRAHLARAHTRRRTRAARRGGDPKGGWGKKRQAEERSTPGTRACSKVLVCSYMHVYR